MCLTNGRKVLIAGFIMLLSGAIFAKPAINSVSIETKVSRKIKSMTLREKVGQLFIVRPESLDPSLTVKDVHYSYAQQTLKISEAMVKNYEKYPAGGVILFSRNIKEPQQVKDFTSQIHQLGKLRPWVCIDEEGGRVSRLANKDSFNLPRFIDMQSIGNSTNFGMARDAGECIGLYLQDFGIDVDFAPVADVNTNPNNPIIGNRAFSPNAEIAGKMAVSFADGLESQGIASCFKHFPGHGDTNTDSHTGYAETNKTWQEMLECEMVPFKLGIFSSVPFVMTAHIAAPKVDDSKLPATLSKKLLTDKLRNELGYEGIIITDAFEMGAIVKKYTPEQAALMAIEAGVDIILIPYDYTRCFEGIIQAVENGVISEERIDESLRRILKTKLYYGGW